MMGAAYDPTLRRDTPLANKLAARIRASGPLSVSAYMDACLNDPEHGYYRTQRAIGRDGDFITAPEISQVFGELIGLWAAVVWQQMGSPARFNLIELGAGRGTLMADALRAVRVMPAFRGALAVHIVDANPLLIAQQKVALAARGVEAVWHPALNGLPTDAPAIWIANEFLDTLPVTHGAAGARRWIGLDDNGRLAFFGARDVPVLETQDFRSLLAAVSPRGTAPRAALFIDYGYSGIATADTLQAVRGHRFEHVLTSPGEADLSVQVDFRAFAAAANVAGLAVDGPAAQAEFLGRLGIVERASKLMADNGARANEIEMGVARLMQPNGMGTRFKAIGLRTPSLQPLPGLETA